MFLGIKHDGWIAIAVISIIVLMTAIVNRKSSR